MGWSRPLNDNSTPDVIDDVTWGGIVLYVFVKFVTIPPQVRHSECDVIWGGIVPKFEEHTGQFHPTREF